LITFKYFRKYLIHILLLGFVISLGLADWGSKHHPYFNYYVLSARGWELLAGSILAYFEITRGGHRSKNQILNLILPTIGLLLIGHSILFFNDRTFHPSLYTLSPIIGVCLIIWFSDKNELITKILSTKVLVGIGLISYSLYIWHYPIFAFNLIRQKYFSLYQISNEYLILLVFVFSIISYYYIEIPFRKKIIKFKRISFLIISTLLFLIFINLLILFNNGFLSRYDSVVTRELIELTPAWDELVNEKGERCFVRQEGCNFNEFFENEVIIIGDSLVHTIALELKNKLEEKNYQSSFYYLGDCHYFPEFNRLTVEKKIKDEKCNTEYFRRIKQRIDKKDNQIIIFFSRSTLAFTNKRFDNKEGGLENKDLNWEYFYLKDNGKNDLIESFKKNIKEISKKNKIILLYPLPEIGWNIKEEILKKQLNDDSLTLNDFSTSYELFQKRNKITFDIFNDLKNKNIYRIYPHKLFCNNLVANRCIVYNGKDLLFRDTVHPSKKGAKMINDLIMKEIEKIELKSN